LLQKYDWQALAEQPQKVLEESAAAVLDRCVGSLRAMSDSITHLYFSHAETRVS